MMPTLKEFPKGEQATLELPFSQLSSIKGGRERQQADFPPSYFDRAPAKNTELGRGQAATRTSSVLEIDKDGKALLMSFVK